MVEQRCQEITGLCANGSRVEDPAGTRVAATFGEGSHSRARLFAASPEMLTALISCRDYLRNYGVGPNGPDLLELDELIARAKGCRS